MNENIIINSKLFHRQYIHPFLFFNPEAPKDIRNFTFSSLAVSGQKVVCPNAVCGSQQIAQQ